MSFTSTMCSRNPSHRISSMPIRDSVKLRRKRISLPVTRDSRPRRWSTATASGSAITAAQSRYPWVSAAPARVSRPPAWKLLANGPLLSEVRYVVNTLNTASCQATVRTSKRRAAHTRIGNGRKSSGRLCWGANTAAVTTTSSSDCRVSSVYRRRTPPWWMDMATGTSTSVAAACDANTVCQVHRNDPSSTRATNAAAPVAATSAPPRAPSTSLIRSSWVRNRSAWSHPRRRSRPATTASAALTAPNRAEISGLRPPE